ncbi:MAG: DUF4959 domain-containing protein [Prevotellaceae bacterium]|nr:DUF4959 domain-containing protein [Prevotellaceae bacterium]
MKRKDISIEKRCSIIACHCLVLASFMIVLLSGCDKVKDWHDPTDAVPPGPVKNIHVENMNGGAKITYTLPDDNDLMGAKAVYTLSGDDIKREVYASAHTDTILLEGYGNTNEYTVEIFAMDKSGNLSVGTSAVIKPLIPPIEIIRQTLQIQSIFGGVYAYWDNELKKDIAVSLYVADSTGYYELFDTYFSNRETDGVAFRGFPSKLQKFRVEIHDRWNNYAEVLDAELTPLFEQRLLGYIDGQFTFFHYGDVDNTWSYRGDMGSLSGAFSLMWDTKDREGARIQLTSLRRFYFEGEATNSLNSVPFPMSFIIDMGRQVSLSRIEVLTSGNNNYMMSVFELWGTNNPKPVAEIGSGSKLDNLQYWTSWEEVGGVDAWKNDWERLGTCRYVLPSGITKTGNTLTAEDIEFITKGVNFDMDFGMAEKSFRYIRFYITETTNGEATDVSSAVQQLQISEIRFFGTYGD